jgi:hypothetical protein
MCILYYVAVYGTVPWSWRYAYETTFEVAVCTVVFLVAALLVE